MSDRENVRSNGDSSTPEDVALGSLAVRTGGGQPESTQQVQEANPNQTNCCENIALAAKVWYTEVSRECVKLVDSKSMLYYLPFLLNYSFLIAAFLIPADYGGKPISMLYSLFGFHKRVVVGSVENIPELQIKNMLPIVIAYLVLTIVGFLCFLFIGKRCGRILGAVLKLASGLMLIVATVIYLCKVHPSGCDILLACAFTIVGSIFGIADALINIKVNEEFILFTKVRAFVFRSVDQVDVVMAIYYFFVAVFSAAGLGIPGWTKDNLRAFYHADRVYIGTYMHAVATLLTTSWILLLIALFSLLIAYLIANDNGIIKDDLDHCKCGEIWRLLWGAFLRFCARMLVITGGGFWCFAIIAYTDDIRAGVGGGMLKKGTAFIVVWISAAFYLLGFLGIIVMIIKQKVPSTQPDRVENNQPL